MKRSIIIIFCLISIIGYANDKTTNTIWESNPKFSTIFKENEKENAVGIFNNEKYEYVYSDEGQLQCIHTIHKKFRLNTDDAVSSFNKIEVSLGNVIELIDLKARAIKPDGKVVNFDEDNIKEVKDEESGNNYKIFAINGINKGDEIEYYVVRKLGTTNYSRYFFQYSYPLQQASFSLTCPKNLLFATKGYNGFPNATYSKLEDERNHYECKMDSIALVKTEKFSYLDPRRARIEWKLAYNFSRGKSEKLTWDDAAQWIYENNYIKIDKAKLAPWLEAINIQPGTDIEKAAQVEDYLKKNVFIQEFSIPEFSDIDYVFKSKVTNDNGIVKIYANILKELGIAHQLAITSSRDKIRFDKDFQSWSYLDDYLIYFPEANTFIDPSATAYRMGCINGNLTATDALFVTPVEFDGFESAIAKTKYIEPTTHLQNFDHMHIEVDIDIDEGQSRVRIDRGFKGLSGGFISNVYHQAEEEYRQGMLLNIMPTKDVFTDYTELKVVETSDIDFINEADFIVHSDLTSENFLEEAGSKILLNIGETIGRQAEMYFEENRKFEVENPFNRSYYREIIVNIPEGYKISNPEAADMNFIEEVDGKRQFGFISKHATEGRQYKIIIDEYYKQIFAGLEHFEGYKSVVNAAADFNKVVLVLEEE
ncbi:DUF3857 domain-containing protein [Puteibacter caeruleilacunae]|nr:DUF3857 domain-containing protein [Puteibacter caeruleilacunae]